MAFYIFFFIKEFGKQLIETGDARFSRGEYVYKRVRVDENARDRDRDETMHLRNASL
jgi:hypothetical protein